MIIKYTVYLININESLVILCTCIYEQRVLNQCTIEEDSACSI